MPAITELALILCGALLALALLGLFIASIMPGVDRWSKRFFIVLFAILTMGMTALTIDMINYGRPGTATLEKIVWYIESLADAVPMMMMTVYLLHCCGEDWRKSGFFRAVLVLSALFFILLGVSQFAPVFYYFSPENEAAYSPWYPLLLVPMDGVMILNVCSLIRRRGRLSKRHYYALLIYMLPMTVGLIIHTLIFNFLFLDIGITLFTLAMFAIVVLDQLELYMRQQREIAHQRANIMVLQMRPHFIYNTMTSIYYLCDQDARKAKQVTMDFTTYLRKNFNAIASDSPIPFSEELAHTRAYLAVEQAQFEDTLFVEYDTPHLQFRLPPLTLQPIVENAVKHGMDPDAGPLRISVKTREADGGSEIIVEDNGSGFDAAADPAPHSTLSNIRQRLQMMCGGTMTIQSRPGGGTVVRLFLPG